MSSYEFQVVPAPEGVRRLTKGANADSNFCITVSDVLSDMGRAGWEFVGTETMPYRRRNMLFVSWTETKSCLVFRREVSSNTGDRPAALPTPDAATLEHEPTPLPRPKRVTNVKSRRHVEIGGPETNQDVVAQIPRRKQRPLRLENPVQSGSVIVLDRHKTPKARAALDALERAMSTDDRGRNA